MRLVVTRESATWHSDCDRFSGRYRTAFPARISYHPYFVPADLLSLGVMSFMMLQSFLDFLSQFKYLIRQPAFPATATVWAHTQRPLDIGHCLSHTTFPLLYSCGFFELSLATMYAVLFPGEGRTDPTSLNSRSALVQMPTIVSWTTFGRVTLPALIKILLPHQILAASWKGRVTRLECD